MNILILIAGTNSPSNSEALADAFMRGAAHNPNVTMEKIAIRDLSLEHFRIEHYDPGHVQEADFQKLQERIMWADGIVISTPIWNFSVPAHLKNLIDRIGSFALDDNKSKGMLNGKAFFLIFTGGAPKAAWKGMMRFTTGHITAGLEYFDCVHFGTFFEGKCMRGRGQFGFVMDKRPDVLQKVEQKGEKFVRMATRYTETGKLPLHKLIYRTLYSLGQRIVSKL